MIKSLRSLVTGTFLNLKINQKMEKLTNIEILNLNASVKSIRDTLIIFITTYFNKYPDTQVEMAQWDIYTESEAFYLTYSKEDDLFQWGSTLLVLEEFCTEDLLYITENLNNTL